MYASPKTSCQGPCVEGPLSDSRVGCSSRLGGPPVFVHGHRLAGMGSRIRNRRVPGTTATCINAPRRRHARGMGTFRPTTMLGQPRAGLWRHFKPYWRGQSWEYDGVSFKVLYPERGYRASRNNGSCVVLVSSRWGQRALLTGDIEAQAEAQLLAWSKCSLRSEILLVPHHGSHSSSSAAFIQSVQPDFVTVSAGLCKRFGFPHFEVAPRYVKERVQFYNTATAGALRVCFRRDRLAVTQVAV